MSSINKVILIGYMANDPEIRGTEKEMATFRVATSDSWRDKATGEKKERTEWHSVVVFENRLIPFIKQYVKKGARVYVEGALQTRKWKDDTGKERYITEVVLQAFGGKLLLLDKGEKSSYPEKPDNSDINKPIDLDDEIPFALVPIFIATMSLLSTVVI